MHSPETQPLTPLANEDPQPRPWSFDLLDDGKIYLFDYDGAPLARFADYGGEPEARLVCEAVNALDALRYIRAALEDIAGYAAPGNILDPLAGDGQNLATVGAIARDALKRMEGEADG